VNRLEKLIELAESATPGPWEVDGGGYVCTVNRIPTENHGDMVHEITGYYGSQRHRKHSPNHDFIAAANPEAIKLVVEDLKRLRRVMTEAFKLVETNQNLSLIKRSDSYKALQQSNKLWGHVELDDNKKNITKKGGPSEQA